MKILNATRKTVLAEYVEVAKTPLSKTKGLMFRASLKEGEGLLMEFSGETKPSIWMPFMRFPLDLVFISAGKKVVDVKQNVRPLSRNPGTWKIYLPKEKCRWVLEVNAGKTSETKTSTGDVLDF
jgi:uncharacterized membrane protein (UPF0127 family)